MTVTTSAPRFRYVPTFASSAGQDCIDLAAHAGLILDPWQQDVVIDALGERAGGGWASTEVGLLVPRQNGKGGILEAIELFLLFAVSSVRLITHTAHRFDTCLDHFRRVKLLIENTPDLLAMVNQEGRRRADGLPPGIKDSNGSESIQLSKEFGRSLLAFKARERGSGRGFPGDVVVFDEAFQMGELTGLVSSLSAATDPQIWFTSSHPLPGPTSDSLRQIMRTGRALAVEGGEKRKTYIEYGCEDDADLNDPAELDRANPGRACGRLNDDILEVERGLYTEEELQRERFGIVSLDAHGGGAIDTTEWAALENRGSQRPSPVALSVEMSTDRRWSVVGLAGRRPDGNDYLQIVQSAPGAAGWVVKRIVELDRQWKPVSVAVAGNGPAASLVPALERAGIEVRVLSEREVARGCGLVFDGVTEKTVRHGGGALLAKSVGVAQKRRIGEAFVWAEPEGVDISPLRAVTNALYGLVSAPEPSKRSGVVQW